MADSNSMSAIFIWSRKNFIQQLKNTLYLQKLLINYTRYNKERRTDGKFANHRSETDFG